MVHASLFTGIGGFDLAAEWMGWRNSFQCEIDPFCQKVLAKNFPDADRYTDIKRFDATPYRGTVDVLSGGFPCQPFSLAGQRKGNQDDRALWPEMLRVIDEVRPRWIVGENVAGLVSLGLDGVLFDLEASGYSVETVLLPACSVGAPHRRDRLWIIAHSQRLQGEQRSQSAVLRRRSNETEQTRVGCGIIANPDSESVQRLGGCGQLVGTPGTGKGVSEEWQRNGDATGYSSQTTPNANELHADRKGFCASCLSQQQTTCIQPSIYSDANCQRREECQCGCLSDRKEEPTSSGFHGLRNKPDFRLTEPPLCGPDDGLPAGLVRVSTRAKQLKAYGNSIVPQVAYEIFQALEAADAAPQ